MSTIGKGYGSEFHFRSAMANELHPIHAELRGMFSSESAQGTATLEWHTNYLSEGGLEVRGMDFLPDAGGEAWKEYWPDPKAGRYPNRDGIHNWDGVGRVSWAEKKEWILVEAKAHVAEFRTSRECGAGDKSRLKITKAFQKTRVAMGLEESDDAAVPDSWFAKGGYQIVNRLASLSFLTNEIHPAQPANLLFIYYINDAFAGAECPRSAVEWKELLRAKHVELGIPENHLLSKRVFYLFPECAPRDAHAERRGRSS